MSDNQATGSAGDMVRRLRAALPLHWFADDAPVLGAVLGGLGASWAGLYDMLRMVRRQSRIGSADGAMLDLIAGDFFGGRLVRRPGQGDGPFRAAILRELLRERATRAALASALADLTGSAPRIFEPTRPADTGAWGRAAGYGVAGGWGSLALPFQCFVQVRRPSGQGIAGVEGYAGLWPSQPIAGAARCTRASPATRFDSALVLREVGAGVPRVDFSTGAGVVLQEPASANLLRNVRAEGAVPGTLGAGGALPTNWWCYATNGLSCAVLGSGTEGGIPYCDVRWWGTTTGSATAGLFFDAATQIAAVSGQSWAGSAFVRLLAGGMGGRTPAINLIEYSAAGSFVGGSGTTFSPGAAALWSQRVATTRTLNGAATAAVACEVVTTFPAGLAVDFTLRIGAPQIEPGTAATSVMLPPAGSPAASSRAAETVAIPTPLPGGYGAGAIEWASLAMVQGQVTDADIYDAAARSMPAAAIAWTAISS